MADPDIVLTRAMFSRHIFPGGLENVKCRQEFQSRTPLWAPRPLRSGGGRLTASRDSTANHPAQPTTTTPLSSSSANQKPMRNPTPDGVRTAVPTTPLSFPSRRLPRLFPTFQPNRPTTTSPTRRQFDCPLVSVSRFVRPAKTNLPVQLHDGEATPRFSRSPPPPNIPSRRRRRRRTVR